MGVDGTSGAAQVTPVALMATTADGVALAGVHFAPPDPVPGAALVVAHAFTHHTRHPNTRRGLPR